MKGQITPLQAASLWLMVLSLILLAFSFFVLIITLWVAEEHFIEITTPWFLVAAMNLFFLTNAKRAEPRVKQVMRWVKNNSMDRLDTAPPDIVDDLKMLRIKRWRMEHGKLLLNRKA